MRRIAILGLVLLLLSAGTARADGGALDPLLQLLVKKGVITEEEARSLQTEAAAAPAPAASAPPAPAPAPPPAELPKGIKGLSLGTLTYLSYQDGNTSSGEDYSRFRIKRGYIDIRKRMTDNLEFRITPDVTQDSTGDLKVRLKYAYAKFGWDWQGLVQKPYLEFGGAHMPWLDFEEHINLYRMQDTMFMERSGLFNSADMGVMFGGNLGPELPEEYRKSVNDHYAGRWGSFAVGVYDGGGYHASEKNDNKAVEGRFSLRPLPDHLPGLQVSLFGISGKGNTVEEPDWGVLAGMVSYESPRLVVTGQYETGTGNQAGSLVGSDGRALDHDGYSLFAEVRLDRDRKWSAIGRLDHFDPSTDDPGADVTDRTIVGVAWQFAKGTYWLLDWDRLEHDRPDLETEDRLQLTLQVKY